MSNIRKNALRILGMKSPHRLVRLLALTIALSLVAILSVHPVVVSAFAGMGGYLSEQLLGRTGSESAFYIWDGTNDRMMIGSVPQITTNPVTDSGLVGGVPTATLKGTITSLNGMPQAVYYWTWGYSAITLTNTTSTAVATTTGVKSLVVSGFLADDEIFYQFHADTDGVGSGSVLSFLTTETPIVVTNEAVDITSTTATLQGTLTDMGGFTPLYASFEWGLTVAYGSTTSEETLTAIQGFSKGISGLNPEATYHFRARVRFSPTEYSYGADETFVATSVVPDLPEPGIDEPDDLSIEDVKIVNSYLEPGDQLIMISYRLLYDDGDPTEAASDYFSFQAIVGTTIRAQSPVRMWGYKPGSIYLSATSAIPSGSELTIKLIGNADKWGVPPEDSYTVTVGDWLGDDVKQIDPWVISLAENMQSFYSTENMQSFYSSEMVIYSAEGTVLSSQGGTLFSMGIPGLAQVRPNLFKTTISYVDDEFVDGENTLQADMETVSRLGPMISGIVEDWGVTNFDVDPDDTDSTWGIMVVSAIAVAVLVFGIVVGFVGALVVCIPLVLVGMFTGGISVSFLLLGVSLLVVFIMKEVWLKGV